MARGRGDLDEEQFLQKQPPFPWKQIIILSLCRVVEPVAFMSISPYVYYMIHSFKVTDDPKRIAIYCGMITSIFAFAEFSTGMIWGKLSDKYGRKPVLMMGLFGTGLSMVMFGFSTSLPMALAARALGGALNGNVGVLQTTVAEVVKTKEQQPFAFSIMPFVWCIGSIIGAALGGALATNYTEDQVVGHGLLDRFPYLLPNLVAAGFVVVGLIIGILFLEETHEEAKKRRDPGYELGRWLAAKISALLSGYKGKRKDGTTDATERTPILYESVGNPYTRAVTHDSASAKILGSTEQASIFGADSLSIPVQKTFNHQVIVQIIAYGIIAYHTISYETLLPVMLSMDESYETPKYPFKFTGGFELPTSKIGIILGAQGVYQMVFQILFFAPIIYKLGSLNTWRLCAFTYPLLYFLTPYTVLLPQGAPRMIGLALVLVFKVTWSALAYPANMLLLTNASPSLLVLGTINGAAASCACLCRALGPTISGVIQAAGLDFGYVGLPWWFSAFVCVIGAIQTLWMKEEDPADSFMPADEDEMDERESIIFRQGSVFVNVSNNAEASIGESQFLANLAHRGSVARRVSVSTRRASNAWSTLSRRPSRQTVMGRERSISAVIGRDRSISTVGPRGER